MEAVKSSLQRCQQEAGVTEHAQCGQRGQNDLSRPAEMLTLGAIHGPQLEQLVVSAVEERCEELLSILLLPLLDDLGPLGYLLCHGQLLPCGHNSQL